MSKRGEMAYMKLITDRNRINAYVKMHHLDPFFSNPESLAFQIRVYEHNERVLTEGEQMDGLYFLLEGRAKVSTSVSTGKSLLLRFCYPLSIFGDIEFWQNVVVQSQVDAVQPSTFLHISKRTVESQLMKDSVFLNRLLIHLSYKLQTCTTASRINLLTSVEERLASYLLTTSLQNEFGKEINTSHYDEIASLIGTTPRHLNRVVQKLREMNILDKAKKKIIVLDWERLDDLSKGLRYE